MDSENGVDKDEKIKSLCSTTWNLEVTDETEIYRLRQMKVVFDSHACGVS